jgi:uncharacterized membrane protein YoaT (DUF817 family)
LFESLRRRSASVAGRLSSWHFALRNRWLPAGERQSFGAKFRSGLFEFFLFGIKQAWACLFGGILLALLLVTSLWWPESAPIARYDALVIAVLVLQVLLIATGLETLREAKVILVFHVVGTAMEIFKTSAGSWSYPESSVLRIGDVPLFSGFMYAAVGSYIARIWRIFDFRFSGYPREGFTWALACAVYINFFSHHTLPDIRLMLFAITAFLFRRTWVHFRPDKIERRMPLLLGFFLVALFIWFAENIATYANAWRYPYQSDAWTPVSIHKLGAWYLLMIISFVLIAILHRKTKPTQ